MKTIALNKKATFNYEVIEDVVAGIKLEGREIKSLRSQKPNFAGSYVVLEEGSAYLKDFTIPRYKHDSSADYSSTRKRLLLLKKSEISRLQGKMKSDGVTMVPMALLLDRQWAKIKIALVRGKKKHDKRRTIKERDEKRRAQRAMRKY